MKIYTKTGDDGTTMLFGGSRVPKYHLRIEAYGTIDELNAFIGLIRDELTDTHLRTLLQRVQSDLFTIGAVLATDPTSKNVKRTELKDQMEQYLEAEIDLMETQLAPLKNFILPGGHTTVSYCHLARCVCRRSERRVVQLAELEDTPTIIVHYLNRLSDFLFVLGRKIANDLGVEEVKWVSEK